ncbi:MAG: UDP-N-acetylglucosamine 2-epimerase (non-hydrolyzing), partial [Alphaproteobacteria bacterium]
TERGEALASGNIELVGTDPARIVSSVSALLDDPRRYRRMARPTLLFGDGRASERIADIVEARLTRTHVSAAPPAAPAPQAAPIAVR